ncbi:MAG: hypothetical protein WDW38_000146 [Sanguina aurantia]
MRAGHASAAVAVLKFFYTNLLHQGEDDIPTPEELLCMLQVADRWQAPCALSTISAALCALGPDTFPTLAAYALPAGLQSSHALSPVMALAQRHLLSQHSDAAATARCPTLLQHFCDLPAAAVLAVLSGSQLSTDAEATVLLLLHHWCEGAVGKSASLAEVQALGAEIRFSRLSGSYFSELMHRLGVPLPTLEQQLELCRYRTLTPKQQGYPKTLKQLHGPASWYLPERKVSPGCSSSDLSLQLSIPFINLLQILSEVKTFLSTQPPNAAASATTNNNAKGANQTASGGSRFPTLSSRRHYHCGFWWMLQLSCSDDDTLWCGVVAEGAAGSLADGGGRSGDALTHGISCDVKIQRPGDPLDPTWWEQFSMRGEVHLAARITNITAQ